MASPHWSRPNLRRLQVFVSETESEESWPRADSIMNMWQSLAQPAEQRAPNVPCCPDGPGVTPTKPRQPGPEVCTPKNLSTPMSSPPKGAPMRPQLPPEGASTPPAESFQMQQLQAVQALIEAVHPCALGWNGTGSAWAQPQKEEGEKEDVEEEEEEGEQVQDQEQALMETHHGQDQDQSTAMPLRGSSSIDPEPPQPTVAHDEGPLGVQGMQGPLDQTMTEVQGVQPLAADGEPKECQEQLTPKVPTTQPAPEEHKEPGAMPMPSSGGLEGTAQAVSPEAVGEPNPMLEAFPATDPNFGKEDKEEEAPKDMEEDEPQAVEVALWAALQEPDAQLVMPEEWPGEEAPKEWPEDARPVDPKELPAEEVPEEWPENTRPVEPKELPAEPPSDNPKPLKRRKLSEERPADSIVARYRAALSESVPWQLPVMLKPKPNPKASLEVDRAWAEARLAAHGRVRTQDQQCELWATVEKRQGAGGKDKATVCLKCKSVDAHAAIQQLTSVVLPGPATPGDALVLVRMAQAFRVLAGMAALMSVAWVQSSFLWKHWAPPIATEWVDSSCGQHDGAAMEPPKPPPKLKDTKP